MSETACFRYFEGVHSSAMLFLQDVIIGAQKMDGESFETRHVASLKSREFAIRMAVHKD